MNISNLTSTISKDGSKLITPIVVEGEALNDLQDYLNSLSDKSLSISGAVKSGYMEESR